MGHGISILKSNCIDFSELPASEFQSLLSETYTVQRNPLDPSAPRPGFPEFNGVEEDGWKIREKCHSTECGINGWESCHASQVTSSDGNRYWRFFMDNGFDVFWRPHACGWRVCDKGRRTFWPTRLKTIEEREEWWKWLDSLVETLKPALTEKNE